MKLGAITLAMSNIAWAPQERLDAYRILAEAGITGLEIAPGLFFDAAEDRFAPDQTTLRAAVAEAQDFGLELVSMQSLLFGVQGAALFEGEDARQSLIDGMTRSITLAGRLGIPNMVFGSPKQRVVPEGMAREEAREIAADTFRILGDFAAKAGTQIAIEANPARYGTNFLNTLEAASGFAAEVDHPAITAILDLGETHVNGSFESVSARLPTLAPHLNHVHVSEPDLAPAPADAQRLVPVLKALLDAGYGKAVSIEMQRVDDALVSVRGAVKRLVEATQMAGGDHA